MSRNRILIFAFALLLLTACSSRYTVIKSNREAYAINNNLPVDSAVIQTYLPYKTQVDAEMNKIIGYAAVDLTINSDPESLLGNFFADAVIHQARKITPNIDFAFPTTKGGLRNPISKGPVTVSNVFELMPFENELVLIELKGDDVLKVANYIAATNGQPVAGLKMNIHNKMAENLIINGSPFNKEKTYQVLTSDYLANGGGDAQGFATPISKKNIQLLVRDALLNEVKEIESAGLKIKSTLDGRITKN